MNPHEHTPPPPQHTHKMRKYCYRVNFAAVRVLILRGPILNLQVALDGIKKQFLLLFIKCLIISVQLSVKNQFQHISRFNFTQWTCVAKVGRRTLNISKSLTKLTLSTFIFHSELLKCFISVKFNRAMQMELKR